MTLMEKLADWLTGGMLTRESERADLCRDAMFIYMDSLNQAYTALEQIAAQETQYANATVKRMAKIAKDAL